MRETDKEIKDKEYINNYLNELKRHFDMPDKKMRSILYNIYKDTSSISKGRLLIKKYMSMLKSFYRKQLKRIK